MIRATGIDKIYKLPDGNDFYALHDVEVAIPVGTLTI